MEREAFNEVPLHHFGLYESVPYPARTWNELHPSENPFIRADMEKGFKVYDQDKASADVREKFKQIERQELQRMGMDEPMLNAYDMKKVIAKGQQN